MSGNSFLTDQAGPGKMAQKFGNSRWVRDGFLDNRVAGRVVGQITFAAVGPVDVSLRGDFKGEIQGRLIIFQNPGFEDEDLAGHVLGGLENPLTGEVSLMSFDPHPHLSPHPYFEWFSDQQEHYRIELPCGAARITGPEEEAALEPQLALIAERVPMMSTPALRPPAESDWI